MEEHQQRAVTVAADVVRAIAESERGLPWGDWMAPDFRMRGGSFSLEAPEDGFDRMEAVAMMDARPHRTRLVNLVELGDGRVYTDMALSLGPVGGAPTHAQMIGARWTVRDGLVTLVEFSDDALGMRRDLGIAD